MVDASECPPTYGAGLMDVHGYVIGGYEALQSSDGFEGFTRENASLSVSKNNQRLIYFLGYYVPLDIDFILIAKCTLDTISYNLGSK